MSAAGRRFCRPPLDLRRTTAAKPRTSLPNQGLGRSCFGSAQPQPHLCCSSRSIGSITFLQASSRVRGCTGFAEQLLEPSLTSKTLPRPPSAFMIYHFFFRECQDRPPEGVYTPKKRMNNEKSPTFTLLEKYNGVFQHQMLVFYSSDISSRAAIAVARTRGQNVSCSCQTGKKMINREGKQTLLEAIKRLQKAGWAVRRLETLSVI